MDTRCPGDRVGDHLYLRALSCCLHGARTIIDIISAGAQDIRSTILISVADVQPGVADSRSALRKCNGLPGRCDLGPELFDDLLQFYQGFGECCAGRPVQSDRAGYDRSKYLNGHFD